MSKLHCPCGHTIVDQTDAIPYKGSLLPDLDYHAFFDWISSETQSYLEAVQQNSLAEWLQDRAYSEDYAASMPRHGEILSDHIHSHYLQLKRDVYQCSRCGRVHVQHASSEWFASYSAENDSPKDQFARNDRADA